MAELGRGDPRWIVSEREDGQNVGNWHWCEKSFTDWFIADLRSRLCEKTIPTSDGNVKLKTSDFKSVEIDAAVRNRKGRANLYVDGKFTLEWSAKVGDEEAQGTFIAHEVDPDWSKSSVIDVTTTDSSSSGKETALSAARAAGRPFIHQAVTETLEAFKAESKIDKLNAGKLQVQSLEAKLSVVAPAPAPAPAPAESRTSFAYKVHWGAPARVLYDVLLDQGRVSAFTRAPAVVEKKEGGAIRILGGALDGRFTKLDENKTIAFDFRGADWPAGVHSKVSFVFDSQEDSCVMAVSQEDIPPQDFERSQAHWRAIWWEPIRHLFGYSMRLEE
eukprot:TRINITY_DN26823_c0_g1_i1.p1 TRINITY_DN26823_c0_g1~~TRINITY_DN26823_c0_g1_i1.p1  ORF type:complete len:331 (+),score=50.55 TRINITY_DN26823_c0_g1_i1:93-1085(+)